MGIPNRVGRWWGAAAAGGLMALAGCGAAEDDPGGDAAAFSVVADARELMLHVVEPAAETYWDAVGWIIDESGETAIRPTTEEEWEAVTSAAYGIAESGNLLLIEGRGYDDPAWAPLSRALIDVGREAIAAAEAEDAQAVFDVGAEVYYVCTACHAQFALETLRPSDDRANAP